MKLHGRIAGLRPAEFAFVVLCVGVALLLGLLLPSAKKKDGRVIEDEKRYREEIAVGEKIGREYHGKKLLARSEVCQSGDSLRMKFYLPKCFPAKRYCWKCPEQSCLFNDWQIGELRKFSGIFSKDFLTKLVDADLISAKLVGQSSQDTPGCPATRSICDRNGREASESCGKRRKYRTKDCGEYKCITGMTYGAEVALGSGPYDIVWPGSPRRKGETTMTNESLACLRAACVAETLGWDEEDVVLEGKIGKEIGITYKIEVKGATPGMLEGFSKGSGIEDIYKCSEEF